MKRTPFCLAVLILIACPTLLAAQESQPASRPAAAEGFAYGPYLQNVTPHSITLVWFADDGKSAAGEATLTAPDGATLAAKAAVDGPAGHAVFTEGLEAATTYRFQVTLADGTLAEGTAATAPEKPADFRFLAYGDTRSNAEVHTYLLAQAMAHKPAFVLHTGDFVTEGPKWGTWRCEFLDVCAGTLRETPFYPVIGNHELIPETKPAQLAEHYRRVFDVPDVEGAGERWYSFQWGGATFFVVDAYSPFDPESAQYKWLETALAGCKTAWKFLSLHSPPYSSHRRGGSAGAREHLVPLCEKYKVTAVFSGHDHGYSRSEKDGVTYIIAAGGGAPLYPVKTTENPYEKFSISCYNTCLVDVTGEKVTITAIDIMGKTLDEATIPRPIASAATP